jgi:hypothetical protein
MARTLSRFRERLHGRSERVTGIRPRAVPSSELAPGRTTLMNIVMVSSYDCYYPGGVGEHIRSEPFAFLGTFAPGESSSRG